MLGDCLERMKEIPDGSVDLILTDPPYGTTACKWDSVIPFEPMWEQLKRVIKPNGAIVATWVGDVLIRMEENPFPDGNPPFVVFNYIPDEGSVYGIPNAELLGDNQEILGAVIVTGKQIGRAHV